MERLVTEIYPWHAPQWEQWQNIRNMQRLSHAVLLYGNQGIGIDAFALHAGRSLLCESDVLENKPCEECKACHLSAIDNHPDQMIVIAENKTIKIEQVLNLIEFLQLSRHSSQHRVAIIRHAEQLSYSSANALLKILEEPPENTVILLSSENISQLLPTIRSRCAKLRFTLTTEQAVEWLAQKLQCDLTQARTKLEQYNMRVLNVLDESEKNYGLFHQQFMDYISHKISLKELTDAWADEPASQIQTWLLKELHYVLKGKHHLIDANMLNLDNVSSNDLEALYRLQIDRCLSVNTNPTPRLLLEASLMEWSRALSS